MKAPISGLGILITLFLGKLFKARLKNKYNNVINVNSDQVLLGKKYRVSLLTCVFPLILFVFGFVVSCQGMGASQNGSGLMVVLGFVFGGMGLVTLVKYLISYVIVNREEIKYWDEKSLNCILISKIKSVELIVNNKKECIEIRSEDQKNIEIPLVFNGGEILYSFLKKISNRSSY